MPTQRGRWIASLLFVTIVGCGHHEGGDQPRFETLADASALGGEAFGIAVDAAGNVYFADPTHARIGRIDGATRAVTTVAGGRNGFCGDGGPALDACFRDVTDVAVDRDGNLYVADRGDEDLGADEIPGRVRQIDAGSGIITTMAGNCTRPGDPHAVDACLSHPSTVLLDRSGGLFVGTNGSIFRIDLATNAISLVAGTDVSLPGVDCDADDGPATESCIGQNDLALDDAGNLYVLDRDRLRVRRIDAETHRITTIPRNCSAPGEPGDAGCLAPDALIIDADGNLVLATTGALRIVDPTSGTVRRLLTAPITFPSDLETDARGRLLIGELGPGGVQRIRLP